MLNRIVVTLGLSLLAAFAGCSRSDGRLQVSGTVSLDGNPLPNGSVMFFPTEPGMTPNGATISNGRFALGGAAGIQPGAYRVEIRSYTQSTELASNGEFMEMPTETNIIPPEYNEKTTLTVVIQPNDVNDLKFELSSNPNGG